MKKSEFQAISKLSGEADLASMAYLKKFQDWKMYRKNIEATRETRPEPGYATWLGCFTSTRDEQLAIPNRCIVSQAQTSSRDISDAIETDPVSARIRSHGIREE
jgi:hypothetical protein